MRAIVCINIKEVARAVTGVTDVCPCYLSVPESGPAGLADFDCRQKCHCRCAASPPQVTVSGSGWLCSCWLLAYSAYSCST